MSKFTAIIAIFLTLVFIGQSFATVSLPCTTMGSTPDMQQMAGMDYDSHSTHEDTNAATDCCDSDDCTMTGCLSPSSIISSEPYFDADFSKMVHYQHTFSYLTPELLSLNRPPISR